LSICTVSKKYPVQIAFFGQFAPRENKKEEVRQKVEICLTFCFEKRYST